MLESILAIAVLGFLILGGSVGCLLKYLFGLRQSFCREERASAIINILNNDHDKNHDSDHEDDHGKMSAVHFAKSRNIAMRKGEHAHGNI